MLFRQIAREMNETFGKINLEQEIARVVIQVLDRSAIALGIGKPVFSSSARESRASLGICNHGYIDIVSLSAEMTNLFRFPACFLTISGFGRL